MSAAFPRGRALAAAAAVIVVAVIGWLVWPSPPEPVVLKTGTPQHLVTVTIDSLRLGDTAVDIAVTDRDGAPVDHAAVRIQANQPLMGHAGTPVQAAASGPGRFHAASVPLMMTGPWELRLLIDAHNAVDQVTVPLWVGG
ncbi:YtkA-like protein [Nocardia tenerifensis]|uniref:YtkA-like protein n=1 Tax=Nocardia tenerifensis TaxID=228006 RepID=A0A318KJ20_9NOCA|nr:FixH family protein [Nocardia tenerifensis]PXX60957.1 YtkA-like protein [Nocardia tenerifensis]